MSDAFSPPSQARGMCAVRVCHSRHERSPAHSVAAYGNGAFQIAGMVLLMLCDDLTTSSGIGAQSGGAIYGREGGSSSDLFDAVCRIACTLGVAQVYRRDTHHSNCIFWPTMF